MFNTRQNDLCVGGAEAVLSGLLCLGPIRLCHRNNVLGKIVVQWQMCKIMITWDTGAPIQVKIVTDKNSNKPKQQQTKP